MLNRLALARVKLISRVFTRDGSENGLNEFRGVRKNNLSENLFGTTFLWIAS